MTTLEESTPASLVPKTPRGKSILLIEDEPAIISLVQARIAESSIPIQRIEVAQSIPEALDVLKLHLFDAILLDLGFPGSPDPADAIGEIHLLRKHCAVIVLTGSEHPDLWRRSIEGGAEDFFQKKECLDSADSWLQVTHAILSAIYRYGRA